MQSWSTVRRSQETTDTTERRDSTSTHHKYLDVMAQKRDSQLQKVEAVPRVPTHRSNTEATPELTHEDTMTCRSCVRALTYNVPDRTDAHMEVSIFGFMRENPGSVSNGAAACDSVLAGDELCCDELTEFCAMGSTSGVLLHLKAILEHF